MLTDGLTHSEEHQVPTFIGLYSIGLPASYGDTEGHEGDTYNDLLIDLFGGFKDFDFLHLHFFFKRWVEEPPRTVCKTKTSC